MITTDLAVFENELLDRKSRLEMLRPRLADSGEIRILLNEVDGALRRLGSGSYGLCDDCHDPIEKDRLLADPLLRFCLDHLTVRQRRALEEDLETARHVQRALLPTPRGYPGWDVHYVYEPMGVVSGDYCDVVVCGTVPSRLRVLFGDVAGKGVSASLLMSHMHAMFRSLSMQDGGIDLMLEQANRLLCASTQQSHYATLVCVETSANGDLEICNAGHCSPLVFQSAGSSSISATGLPLGLFSSGTFPATKIRLEVGDVILLYSDGLIESENPAGEDFGADRLEASLEAARNLPSAAAVVELCVKNLTDFLGGAMPSDDLSLMAIRRTPAEG